MKLEIRVLPAIFFFLLSPFLYGQIIGTDAFMQGLAAEVAVNECGVYGSQGSAPDGFHPNVGSAIGFVADADEDGWESGSPEYCGDFFVPGTPEEGWALQHGDNTYTNHDQSCYDFDIEGSIASYSYLTGLYTVTWEGEISSENIEVTQITTFPEDKLYFVTRVLICNNTDSTLNNIYYMRNVDPDQDQPFCGTFNTTNEIIYQPPIDDRSLVTAIGEGSGCGCYLGLGSLDPNARSAFGNFFTTDGIPSEIWSGDDGSYSIEIGDETSCDCGIQIVFKVDPIAPGECKCIAFAYILDEDDLDEALNATLTYDLNVNGIGVPSGGSYAVCNVGDTANLSIVGADTSYFWSWSPETGLSTSDGPVVTATVTDTVTYTATGVGGFCGDATITVTLFPDEDEYADAGDDTEICFGLSTTLNGDGGVSDSIYLWSPTTGLSDPNNPSPVASPTETTTYTLTTFDIWGCPETDEITVTVNPLPNVDAGPDVSICVDGQVAFEASGAVVYEWSPSDGLSSTSGPNPVCTVDDETTYTVTGTDENGCINTDEITVSVNYLPDVTATADPIFIDTYVGETSQLNASGAETYVWTPETGLSNPNIANPTASPQDTTVYIVAGTDQYGCVNYDTITLYAIGELSIDLPNAFTPNGDGINDYYFPIVQGSGDLLDFSIYNRWGQLVHKATLESDGWDGKQNGKDAEVGSYIIIVNAATSTGESRYKEAYFILVR
jgi:gliding motility-associated-like protein